MVSLGKTQCPSESVVMLNVTDGGVGSSGLQQRNQKGQEAKYYCSRAGDVTVGAPGMPSMSSVAT